METQDEINKMEAEVLEEGETPETREVEKQWIEATRDNLKKEHAQVLAAFKMARYLRDDTRIRTLYGDIQKIRAAMGYAEKRLSELNAE